MPVVLGAGWPGVLLHEAVGHGLEGDFNRKGTSTYAGRMGQRVASPGVTIVDDGTLDGRRGSLNIDDERSEEHTSELQSLMRISYAVFCLKKKKKCKEHTVEQIGHNY